MRKKLGDPPPLLSPVDGLMCSADLRSDEFDPALLLSLSLEDAKRVLPRANVKPLAHLDLARCLLPKDDPNYKAPPPKPSILRLKREREAVDAPPPGPKKKKGIALYRWDPEDETLVLPALPTRALVRVLVRADEGGRIEAAYQGRVEAVDEHLNLVLVNTTISEVLLAPTTQTELPTMPGMELVPKTDPRSWPRVSETVESLLLSQAATRTRKPAFAGLHPLLRRRVSHLCSLRGDSIVSVAILPEKNV